MQSRTIEYRRINSSELVPKEPTTYVDTTILPVFDQLAWGPNLILKGPKGTGKTLSIEVWAARKEVPLLRYTCSEESTLRDLVGAFVPEGAHNVYFQLGVLSSAIDIANDEGACVVVLEEINLLTPQAQTAVYSLADYRRSVEIPKIGKVFRLKEGHGVWLLGTMNPNYSGTYNLNEALRSRFQLVDVQYLPTATEKEILYKQFEKEPNAIERQMVSSLLTLAAETRSGSCGYALSLRDLEDFVRVYIRMKGALPMALKVLEGKFDAEHTKDIRTRIKSTFNIDLEQVRLY